MKLQVIKNPQDVKIEGMPHVTIQEVFQGMSHVYDNQCEEILIGDTINSIPFNSIEKFLLLLIKKVRINGTIKISGVNLRALVLGVKNGTIEEKNFNEIIESCISITSPNMVADILRKYNLKIDTIKNESIYYGIEASRKN